ncbi:amidohydrolase family protein [Caulobacter sp. NIBR2454]|uniref:amidohydrolase family protein n=1 Tax=Caulobacter sp. NIBR2454 TaxID=3015996 RepID=UPI0022B7062E|nr:amidohydrolase family protein [Caulobacter sp. NIBR2454]
MIAWPVLAIAEPTTAYVVLTSGQLSGEMAVTATARGREIAYSFNDRGRGPSVTSVISMGADLSPVSLSVTGVDYYKLAVDERFDRAGGTATWKAAGDSGSVARTGFYWPSESNPEHLAMLARALLKAPNRELDLLPAGRARIEPLLERQVMVAGVAHRANLYAVTGLGFGAQPIWLDGRGELLLSGSDWSATVRKGVEDEAKLLLRLQIQSLNERDLQRTAALTRKPAGPVVFRNVALFDAQARVMRPGSTVVVRGNRILSVGPDGSVPVPDGAQIIEGAGKTLLPGLWDMHVHVSSNTQGLMHMAAGVTSVRDLANNLAELTERRRNFESGAMVGPRIEPAGFIDGPGPLAGPIKVLVSTPDEMRAAIRSYAAQGYRQIKLYSSLDPKLIPVAAEECRRLGLRLSGHVPAGMTMRQAVEDGYDEVHHLNFAALNFMRPEINAKTNGITRITAIAEHAWEIDMTSPQVTEFIAFLKAKGAVVDPTFSLYENHLLGRAGKADPNLAAVVNRLPPVVRRGSFAAGLAKTDEEARRNAVSYKHMQALLKALHDAGVPLVPGTDTTPGFAYQRELELYTEAGIAPLDVLYMATLGSARVAGREAELGSITPGRLADMVLIDGAPDQRMTDVRKVELVMKDGAIYDPRVLLAEIGVAPAL